jgi:hypothetical protein
MSAANAANAQQSTFTRQATILRRNLGDFDGVLHNPRGEDWSKMLGRLNASLNQAFTLDNSIEDVMEHFVYLPKQSTANPQDIPFFLSTKLDSSMVDEKTISSSQNKKKSTKLSPSTQEFEIVGDPIHVLSRYEGRAAELAQEYEEEMVRFY